MIDSASEGEASRALSPALEDLLVELSTGVHRYRIYPPGHPSLLSVADAVTRRLHDVLGSRESIDIAAAGEQLVIDEAVTRAGHPLHAELAERMHEHRLAVVSFLRGVTPDEIVDLLRGLAQDAERQGKPMGLAAMDAPPEWAHVRLQPLGYEHLGMLDGESGPKEPGTQVDGLWLKLAQAALGGHVQDAPESAEELVEGLHQRVKDASEGKVVARRLLELAQELRGSDTPEGEQGRRHLSSLVGSLDEATLERLVELSGGASERLRFVGAVNEGVSGEAVVRLVQAVAGSVEQGISHSMVRLLTKLAAHADAGEVNADQSLREWVDALLSSWELEDPNPGAYTDVLDNLARLEAMSRGGEAGEEDTLASAQRIVEMALEVDAFGPTVQRAATELVEARGAGHLLAILDSAPGDSQSVNACLIAYLTEPDQLRGMLAKGQIDGESLARLAGTAGIEAIDPMLDSLAESGVQEGVIEVLVALGEPAGRRAAERLARGDGDPGNLLDLLRRLPGLPPGFDPQPHTRHQDPRVRAEALRLALRVPETRERTLVTAFMDSDEGVVRVGLEAVAQGVPTAVLPTLVSRVVAVPERSSEVRVLGIEAMTGDSSQLVLRSLLEVVVARKTLLLRTPRIAPGSPEVLAALRILNSHWLEDPEVRRVLNAAGRSKNPAVRDAAGFGPPLGVTGEGAG